MARAIEILSKVVLKSIGNPKNVTVDGAPERILLGRIVGVANKVISRTMPTGETYEGLSGSFEATPTDESKPIIRSGICFLPLHIQNGIAEAIVGEDGKGKNNVRFAFDVYTIKATNAQGYSWSLVPLIAAEIDDPLAALKADIAEMAALPAPEPAAPEKGKK